MAAIFTPLMSRSRVTSVRSERRPADSTSSSTVGLMTSGTSGRTYTGRLCSPRLAFWATSWTHSAGQRLTMIAKMSHLESRSSVRVTSTALSRSSGCSAC